MLEIMKNSIKAPERKRLAAEVDLTLRLWSTFQKCDQARLAHARELLGKAESNAKSGDLDTGWKYLHEARCLSLFEIPEDQLDGRASSLQAEAEDKGSAWRRIAIGKLLEQFKQGSKGKRSCLAEAYRVSYEGFDNVYFKMRTLRRQMFVLGCCMLILIVAFIILFAVRDLWASKINEILSGGLLGGIGACLSGLSSFAAARPDQRIPETLSNVSVTLTRPAIGIASGIIAILAIKANLIPLKVDSAAAAAVGDIVALAFGFSERLVIGTFEKVGSGK
jgi:hypothetical protein